MTGENPGGLTLALPARNRIEPVCLPWRRAYQSNGGGLERQARGLEFAAGHDKGQATA